MTKSSFLKLFVSKRIDLNSIVINPLLYYGPIKSKEYRPKVLIKTWVEKLTNDIYE